MGFIRTISEGSRDADSRAAGGSAADCSLSSAGVESRFVNIALTGSERQARKIARLKAEAGAARKASDKETPPVSESERRAIAFQRWDTRLSRGGWACA